MRVVQLGPWPPPHGGIQTNMVSIRRFLREHGHSCAIINLTRFRSKENDDIYYPESGAQVWSTLRRLRPDVIHLHIGGSLTPRLLALAFLCTLMPGARAVLSFHSGGYPSSPEGLSARPFTLRGMVFRRLDGVIAVNAEIEKLFVRFGVPQSRIRLIYPHETVAVPSTPYPPALAQFIEQHRPFLFTVGLLEPEYDLPLQIETLGRIREAFPDAGLVIAGAGSLEQDLRAKIAAQPWASHVLLWGDMPHAVTLRAIAECDALLRTTRYDGDSIAVREALALGTPVIATDNGMRPAGVHLIPPRDPAALLAAVRASFVPDRPRMKPGGPVDQSNIEAVVTFYQDLLGKGARH